MRSKVSVPYWGSLSSNIMKSKLPSAEKFGFRPLLGFSIF